MTRAEALRMLRTAEHAFVLVDLGDESEWFAVTLEQARSTLHASKLRRVRAHAYRGALWIGEDERGGRG
jgi:hypothetical protein